MGKVLDDISPRLREWIENQHIFFVATAPNDGHVNLSPKGHDTFRVGGPTRVAYLDLTGSGAESIAHIRQNGRITFMFCSFEGRPDIVRLYGTAEVCQVDDPDFEDRLSEFDLENAVGTRSIISAEISRVSSSCGFSIPFMDYVEERSLLKDWADRKGADGVADYHGEKNQLSIDGLPAFQIKT